MPQEYQMKNWLPLTQVQTQKDMETYKGTYAPSITEGEFRASFPKLDPKKVFFDGCQFHNALYFDKEKMVLRELPLGRRSDGQREGGAWALLSPTPDESGEDALLKAIDMAYEERQRGNWIMFAYGLMPYYRRELLSALLAQAEDLQEREKILEAMQVED